MRVERLGCSRTSYCDGKQEHVAAVVCKYLEMLLLHDTTSGTHKLKEVSSIAA